MAAMRPWLALAVLAPLGGCAQVLGIDDPVPEHPVSNAVDGEYLLAIDLQSSSGVAGVLEMRVPLSVDPDSREIFIDPIALAHGDRSDLDGLGAFNGDIENSDELDFSIEWQLDIPAEATVDGVAISWDGQLDGHFPILDGQDAPTTDGFCGTIDGTLTAPGDAQIQNTTFGALKLEVGSLPAQALSCADPRF
jgi:hypothetical protein